MWLLYIFLFFPFLVWLCCLFLWLFGILNLSMLLWRQTCSLHIVCNSWRRPAPTTLSEVGDSQGFTKYKKSIMNNPLVHHLPFFSWLLTWQYVFSNDYSLISSFSVSFYCFFFWFYDIIFLYHWLAPEFLLLPWCFINLSSMRSYNNASRTDVTLTSIAVEEVEASARSLLDAILDGLMAHFCSFSHYSQLKGSAKSYRLILTRALNLVMMAKTAFILWANSVLKRCDAVLAKIAWNITYKYEVEMLNTFILLMTELLTLGFILKSVEKLKRLLQYEAIRKPVSFKRKSSRPSRPKWLWSQGSTRSRPSTGRWLSLHLPQPYHHIILNGKGFQFLALCFGLFTAPQVFTWLFFLVSYKNSGEIRLLHCLDDWLTFAKLAPCLLECCGILQLC